MSLILEIVSDWTRAEQIEFAKDSDEMARLATEYDRKTYSLTRRWAFHARRMARESEPADGDEDKSYPH